MPNLTRHMFNRMEFAGSSCFEVFRMTQEPVKELEKNLFGA